MTGRHFDTNLTVVLSREFRIQLAAISFHMGQKGMCSRPAKKFMAEGVARYLAALTPKERATYDEILKNVTMIADAGGLEGVKGKPKENPGP